MNRDEKAAVVEKLAAQIGEAEAIFAVDYRGISVPQAAELREKLTEAGASFRVVKNRLTIRAADQAGTEDLKVLLEGPTAFTFVGPGGDAALAAKAIATFRKQNDVLEFKGGQMDGVTLTIDEIEAIAKLPARDVLHGQLVGMLASPVTGLVRGLNALLSGVAIALQQIHDEGKVGGDAPAAEPEAPAAEEAPDEEAQAEDAPADEEKADEVPAEAPGDPVAEGEAAEEEQPTSGDDEGGGEEPPAEDSPAEDDKEG